MSTQVTSPFETANGAMVPVDRESPPEDAARERRERVRNFPPLLKYLVKTCETIEGLDREDRVRVRTAQVRCQAYYDGRQRGQVTNGRWVDDEYTPGEIQPQDNQYKIQIDKLHMEMCRSNISVEVDPKDNTPEMQEAARFFQSRIEAAQNRIETEPFVQAENSSLLLKMCTFRYTYFDPTAPGESKELMPKVEAKIGGTESHAIVCRTCGAPKAEAEFPAEAEPTERAQSQVDADRAVEAQEETHLAAAEGTPCERCGDTETREIAVQPAGGLSIDYEEMPGGQVVTRRPDATMVQLDMSARDIPSSRFIRWRLSLRRYEWEAMFPGKKIPKGNERSDEARYADDLQGHASNDSGWGLEAADTPDITGGEQFERIEGDLTWLDPVVYREYVNKRGEMLPGGKQLEPGLPLGQMFPDGLCVVKINKTVLDLFPSNKNKHWSMCVYGIREHALHGSGTLSLLGPQDTINDENAFIVANHYYNAAPREFIREGAISGGQLPPINKVGVVTGDIPADRDIVGYAYDKAEATSLAGDVYGFREGQLGSMQEHAGTSSLSMQGASDMKALGTATGVEASRDMAVGRMIPNRKLQAAMVVEWGYQVGDLERENCTPERFLSMCKGDEKGEVKFTERGVRAFFDCDPRTAFTLRPTADSVSLLTATQKKANAIGFAQIAAQIQDPEILSLLAPSFGVEYDINEWGAAQRTASLRLREYARIAGVITKGGYPASEEMAAVVLSQCPAWAIPDPEMDDHKAFRDFYLDWWTSDEGNNADELLRLTVKTVFGMHRKGDVKKAQDMAEDTAEAQIPAKGAEMISKHLDATQAQNIQGAQMEEAQGMQAQQMEQQQALAEKDREHEAIVGAAASGAIPVSDALALKQQLHG